MVTPKLEDLLANAAASDGPDFPPETSSRLGGVDPLGLRQLNFNIMDELLPGVNNVAKHVRPFVVIAWAWRRAGVLAQHQASKSIPVDTLVDFVDRIEVIYAWSQLINDRSTDLPGRLVLEPILNAPSYTFGGTNWQSRRKARRYSTALSSPLNYGPGLKMLGWVQRHPEQPEVLLETKTASPALDAFEDVMRKHLDHPAFSSFGKVTVESEDVKVWAADWAITAVTPAERTAMATMLTGDGAAPGRRLAVNLMVAGVNHATTTDTEIVRSTLAGAPSNFIPPSALHGTWRTFRRLQVRQLFRLTLEALFWWMLGEVGEHPLSMDAMVSAFMSRVPSSEASSKAGEWFREILPVGMGVTEVMSRITQAMYDYDVQEIPASIVAGLAYCLAPAEPAPEVKTSERSDRLPLERAQKELVDRADQTVPDFLRHVFESWILAQHVFWSVGRGLADARAGARTLLRLKVVLDEGGWMLAPGVSQGNPPVPTADRLATILSLARECGAITPSL